MSDQTEPFWPETDQEFDLLFSVAEAALREVGLGDKYEVVETATGLPWVHPDANGEPDEDVVNRAFTLAWEASERSRSVRATQPKEAP